MKTNFTRNLFTAAIALALSLSSFKSNAQNLLSNSGFDLGNLSWLVTGMLAEINPETTYGGSAALNRVAEIDAQVGLRQKLAGSAGKTYTLTYKASRRTRGTTPAAVGMRVRVVGNNTGNVYLNYTEVYTNTSFGFSNKAKVFTVPANSVDDALILEMTGFNNPTTHGVIVDDVEMVMASASSLPVQWVSFTAELRNQQALLNWKTASEYNNSHFVVERSSNGTKYDSIGTVTAGASHNYSFVDGRVLNGTSFYRLRQVDIDGASKYSKVVTVKTNAAGSGIKLFPTVASSTVNFNVTADTKADVVVSVFDANGRMMIRSQRMLAAGANQQSVDVSSLGKGSYYFQLRSNDGTVNYSKPFQKID
jgi:hypothetical protein